MASLADTQDLDQGALLSANDLSVRLGSAPDAPFLFQHVSLALAPAELVDLVGPSGSGKTTLLRVLARLHPYAAGELLLDGVRSEEFSPQLWRTRVALLPQQASFIEGTVADNLLMPYGFSIRDRSKSPDDTILRSSLDAVGLDDIALDRSVDRLSVGQAARVALCRTLLTKPDVLLLDEADAALDPDSVERISILVARYVQAGRHACLRIRHRDSDTHTMRRLRFVEGCLSEKALDD